MNLSYQTLLFILLVGVSIQTKTSLGAEKVSTASDIYRTRIVPLIESPERSSCSQCHLGGVELNDFLSVDQAKTFSDLRARGWIDVDHPDKSKLLDFIRRGSEDSDPLRHRVQQAEYSALKTWIEAAVREPSLLNESVQSDGDLQLSVEFIRHARKDKVLARFSDAIWSQLQRCAHCHSPDRNENQVAKHGEQMTWIVPRDPVATLALLTERKLIDVDHPEDSQLVTKPTLLVKHGGGPKFTNGSLTDRRWRSFIEDYAKLVRDGYPRGATLPREPDRRSWLSEMQLKILNMPEAWRGRLMTASLHALDANDQAIEQPIAIADGPVARRTLVWQAAFTVYAPIEDTQSWTQWSEPLGAQSTIDKGRYQLQLRLGSLVISEDFQPVKASKEIIQPTLVATAELVAPWPPGYQPPKILNYSELKQIE